jgi:hypothetical protein
VVVQIAEPGIGEGDLVGNGNMAGERTEVAMVTECLQLCRSNKMDYELTFLLEVLR